MKVTKLYLPIAALAALALGAASCGSSTHAAPLLPQATAPSISAVQKPPAAAAKPANKPPVQAAQLQTSQSQNSQPQAKPDPVVELITAADKEYTAGQDHFKAGDHEAAKESFDNAFDLLMDSKLDIHSDPRLEAEYNKVLAGENSVELQAIQQQPQSDNSDAQKSEPAPIDEINDTTPAVDANVKAKAEAEIKGTHSDLPLMLTDPVAGYINYFSNRGHGTLEHALERSGRYQDMIQTIFKEEGVPQDLIFLAQAESGFHPLAVSRVGARGLWQFMSFRGKAYGLKRTAWEDDRQDPEKSTRAAAHHLKDLYNQFGDWYLAMAAYNSGPGTVQQAVKRTGYADFWELYNRNVLPKETRNYVPIIVAMTIMAKNPAQYGLEDIVREQPVPYDRITIGYPVDLRLVAQCVGSTPTEMQDLNPSLLRWSTPKDGTFELHVPQGTKDQYEAAIAKIPENMRVWWRLHKVESGETLVSIARRYRVTAQAIRNANELEDSTLEPSANLIIPVAPGRQSTSDTGSYARRITRYHVHRGDTVDTVADNLGVPAIMVRRWNHLKGNSLAGRKVLFVHLPVTPHASDAYSESRQPAHKSKETKEIPASDTASGATLRHTVQAGETLYSIANTYRTTVSAIQRDNRIEDVASLRAGTVLVIHGTQ
jgi:membrane-bound lytic murein transglycosylase D